jgi:hypothetical protein
VDGERLLDLVAHRRLVDGPVERVAAAMVSPRNVSSRRPAELPNRPRWTAIVSFCSPITRGRPLSC